MRALSFISLFLISDASAYVGGFSTRRSAMTMRKGRKSLKKTIKNSTRGGIAGTNAAAPETRSKTGGASWYPVKGIKSLDDITKEENVVQLIETQVGIFLGRSHYSFKILFMATCIFIFEYHLNRPSSFVTLGQILMVLLEVSSVHH